MADQFTKLLIFAFLLANLAEAKNKCFKEGITWNTKGQLEFIPQVDFHECTRAFLQNSEAKGFTWFEDYSGYKDICIIFGELHGKQSCKNCLSFKQTGNCVCEQQQGQCEITENNFISASYAESEVECYIQCSATDGCEYYTWLNKDHGTYFEECLLFSSCGTVNQCNQGCFVGSVDCDISPTTTPITTSTTTLPDDPCYDIDYHILDDETRNLNNFQGDYFCDGLDYKCKSPDWKGSSWYRFDGPGGTKIPEHVVEEDHCNTFAPGWLNGTHPTILGETVERIVCFNGFDDFCGKKTGIQIKHCGTYFLYYLEDIITNAYFYRYCSESNLE